MLGSLHQRTPIAGSRRPAEPTKKMPPKSAAAEKKKTNLVTLGVLLVAWYTLNVQLAAGIVYILPIWTLGLAGRKFPSGFNVPKFGLLAGLHGFGHFATVISLGAGSVAFANVVKAAEPFCAVLMGVLIQGIVPPLAEMGALVPIIAGVMIASMAEPEFSMIAFTTAMLSNFLFAARGTVGKILMTSKPGEKKISGADVFAINIILATIVMAPVAIVMEGAQIQDAWSKYTTGTKPVDYMALINGELDPKVKPSPSYFAAYLLVCGLYYYTYNEMAFMVLDLLDPVGQAVGNTVKRVVIIIAGTIVFNKPLTQQGIIGSTVAIGGVLLYSLVKAGAGSKPAAKAKSS